MLRLVNVCPQLYHPAESRYLQFVDEHGNRVKLVGLICAVCHNARYGECCMSSVKGARCEMNPPLAGELSVERLIAC